MTQNPSPPEAASTNRHRRAGVLVLAVAIAVLLPAAYRMASPFLTAMVLATILAVALDPLRRRVGRVIKRSSMAALLTTIVAVGPVVTVILLAGIAMNREIKSGAFSAIWRAGERLASTASVDRHAIQEALAALNQVAGGLFTGALAVLFLYVLLLYGQGWLAQLTAMLPLDTSVTNRILSTARDAIVANVDGILASATVEAVLFGVVFWIAGIGSPAMWGAVAGIASMVPVVGAMLVWLPLAVTVAIHGIYVKALVVGLVCLAAQEAVEKLLLPRVVGTRQHQPALLIALSVLGGASAFGALGILLGPVIVSVLAALLREFRIQLQPGMQADNVLDSSRSVS
jgi:predicted PurR-regulated permease PerM